ncbi:collagen alpha-1(I) chain-like [Zalophus californianus]|uniref:Collagen alpha-1(I) chain-like n=1 Tax=Zalophus californianus TaxID=9704 RepID=A0A6J2DSS2_ZALCA|nr:collagen alpha-1(I) chain-like [Zalophus californianus]
MVEGGEGKALSSQSNSSNLFQKPYLITSVYGSLATTSTRKAGKYFIAEDTDSPNNKGHALHGKGLPSHPEKYSFKGAWGQCGIPSHFILGGGNLGNIFGLRPSHAAIPRQELCNGASRAGGRGGKKRGRLPQCQLFFSSLGNREARRRGQDGEDPDGLKAGPRKPRFAAEAASTESRGGRPRSAPETAPARFPGLRRGPRVEGAGARAGTATPGEGGGGERAAGSPPRPRRGSPGPYFRLEHPGFQRRHAPARRLALSDGDAAVRVRRNLRGSREPPGPPASPRRPRAARSPRLPRGLSGGRPGSPRRDVLSGLRLADKSSVGFITHVTVLVTCVLLLASLRALPGTSGHSPF